MRVRQPPEMTADRVLVSAAAAYVAAAAFGSAVAMRQDIPGEPFGIAIPVSVPSGLLVGWGAGVAAPWPMPAAAVVAAAMTRRAEPSAVPGVVAAGLGIGCILGTLVEPVTYHRRGWTPDTRAAIAVNLFASTALAGAGVRQMARSNSRRRLTAQFAGSR